MIHPRIAIALAAVLAAPTVLAAKPAPSPSTPRAPAWEKAAAICQAEATDTSSPWLLAHGLAPFGRDFAAADGRQAAQAILQDHLSKVGVPDSGAWAFLGTLPSGQPVESHPNLLIQSIVRTGQPLTTAYQTKHGRVTLGDVVESARAGFRHLPASDRYWQEVAWTLDLFATTHTPGEGAIFQNGTGNTIDLNRIFDQALAHLERANASLLAGMAAGEKTVPKQGQGIYAHPCGGLHFMQALGSWARHPQVREAWGERWTKQIDVLFYRFRSERPQYDLAQQKLRSHEAEVLAQKVKFYGHFLETVGRLRRETGFEPSPEQWRDLLEARGQLGLALVELERKGLLDRKTRARVAPSIEQDLIGDTCHAANGMRLLW